MTHFDFNCVLLPCSNDEVELREAKFVQQLYVDIVKWFQYCQMSEVDATNYYRVQRCRIRRLPFARNGHMFILDAMNCSPKQCYTEFKMYPVMLCKFTHILRDEYGLRSNQQVDVYKEVEMFLCILAHGKGCR